METATAKGGSRAHLPTIGPGRGEVARGRGRMGFPPPSRMSSPRWEHLALTHVCAGCRGGSCALPLPQLGHLSVLHPLVLVLQKWGGHTNNRPSPYVSTYFRASVSPTFCTLLLQLGVCCLKRGVLPAPLSTQPSFHSDLLKIPPLCPT